MSDTYTSDTLCDACDNISHLVYCDDCYEKLKWEITLLKRENASLKKAEQHTKDEINAYTSSLGYKIYSPREFVDSIKELLTKKEQLQERLEFVIAAFRQWETADSKVSSCIKRTILNENIDEAEKLLSRIGQNDE